jgi:hypothetical protein
MRGNASTSPAVHSQFRCTFCGKGFEQRSKLKRHIDTAHPPSAPSAADVQRILRGVKYPKAKQELEQVALQRVSSGSPQLLMLIGSLPDRIYRDSAEVGVALGELLSGRRPRSAAQIAKLEPPSKKGGRSALRSPLISAAKIASMLKGINFPESKRGILTHIRKKYVSSEPNISVLRRIPNKSYRNMADLEKEIGKVK